MEEETQHKQQESQDAQELNDNFGATEREEEDLTLGEQMSREFDDLFGGWL